MTEGEQFAMAAPARGVELSGIVFGRWEGEKSAKPSGAVAGSAAASPTAVRRADARRARSESHQTCATFPQL